MNNLLIGNRAHGVEHRNQDGHLDQQGQAAGQGVVALLAHELGLLLLQLDLVVGVLLLKGVELRLDLGHFAHSLAAGDVQRHQHNAHQQGEDHNGPSIIVDQAVDRLDKASQQIGNGRH